MATTSSGIWTPDDPDDWDLTVDLAATANSIQTVFNGVSTEISGINTRLGRLPFSIATGSVVVPVNNAPGGTATITFPAGRFTSTPIVMTSKQSSGAAKYIPYVNGTSTTGTTVGAYAGDGTSATHNVVIGWVAIQFS